MIVAPLPGKDDALPGKDDALPGKDDALPGSAPALPGSDAAFPTSTDEYEVCERVGVESYAGVHQLARQRVGVVHPDRLDVERRASDETVTPVDAEE